MSNSPTANGSLVQNVLLYDFVSATRGINVQSDVTVRNSIIYNGAAGMRIQDGANGIVENVTIYDMTSEGIDGSGTAASITVRNTIAVNCGVDMDDAKELLERSVSEIDLGFPIEDFDVWLEKNHA